MVLAGMISKISPNIGGFEKKLDSHSSVSRRGVDSSVFLRFNDNIFVSGLTGV